MKSQHPTDEFVRRKLAEQPPEFNEAHWEQALAMLEEGTKPVAFAWLRRWWMLIPVLLLGLASLGWWLYAPDSEEFDDKKATASHIESSISPNKTRGLSNTEKHTEPNPINTLSDEQPSTTPETPLANQNKNNSQQPVSTQASNSADEKVKPAQAGEKQVGIESLPKTDPAISVDKMNDNLQKGSLDGVNDRVLAADGIVSFDSEPESFLYPVFPESAARNDNIILSNDEIVESMRMRPRGYKSHVKKILTESNIKIAPSIPQPDINIIPLNDTRYSRHRLGVMTSLGMAASIGDPKVNGTTPGMGLVYNYRLSRVLQFEAGASYTIRLGLGGRMNFESLRYGFGYEREETTLDFRQRHMLEVPVGLAWSPAARHRIHAGMNFARQLNVHGEITTVVTDNFGKFTTTTTRQSGYRQAYRPMDYSLQLGYSYDLNRNFRLQVLGQYGLTDLTPDDFWNEVRMDRNMQLRLQLNYFLFK